MKKIYTLDIQDCTTFIVPNFLHDYTNNAVNIHDIMIGWKWNVLKKVENITKFPDPEL